MSTITKESIPADLRDTYDYVVGLDGIATVQTKNDIRMLLRKSTLGEAVELVSTTYPDLKAVIRMPLPRQKPWKELPVLLVELRQSKTFVVILEPQDAANLLELLRACGHRADGIRPFTLVGGPWLDRVARQIERPDMASSLTAPDFTIEELRADVARRFDGLTSQKNRCPHCGSDDVVAQNGLRGCNSCKKTSPTELPEPEE